MTTNAGFRGLRSFALDGRPPRVFAHAVGSFSNGLAALSGGSVIAAAADGGRVRTWRAASGIELGTLTLRVRNAEVTAIAEVGDGRFVVGTSQGALSFVSHRGGRGLVEEAAGVGKHKHWVNDIAARGGTIVTASCDETAAVWSTATRERLAVFRDYKGGVLCAAISERLIATGSKDKAIRLHENASGYALVRVIAGFHRDWVWRVVLLDEDTILSASIDQTLSFGRISTGEPLARVNLGFAVLSAAVTHDGRIACVGDDGGAVLFAPPATVSATVQKYAKSLPRSSPFLNSEPVHAVATLPMKNAVATLPMNTLLPADPSEGSEQLTLLPTSSSPISPPLAIHISPPQVEKRRKRSNPWVASPPAGSPSSSSLEKVTSAPAPPSLFTALIKNEARQSSPKRANPWLASPPAGCPTSTPQEKETSAPAPPPLFTALINTEARQSSPDPRANAADEPQPYNVDATPPLPQPAAPVPIAAAAAAPVPIAAAAALVPIAAAKRRNMTVLLADPAYEVGGDGKNSCGTSSPAKKKLRVDTTDDENSFDLEELKAVAWDSDALEALSNEELCRVVAAVMINFEETLRPRLPVLAKCLLSVFASTGVCGDVFVKFPEAELYDMIALTLGKEAEYSSMGAFSTRLFEWRLKRHLQRLRSN